MKQPAVQTKAPEALLKKPSATSPPVPSSRSAGHPILQLQRAIGNQGLQRFIGGAPSARGAQSPLSTRFALGDLRAERTRQVVAPAAGALGLGDDVPVHLDGEAAERTAARGAPALATGGAVYLDPTRFDPDSRAGRYLVAHELVHVAQSRLGGSASVDDAEAEADAAARSYVGGGTLDRPRVPLAPHAQAAGPNDAETRAAPAVPRPPVMDASKVPEGTITTVYSFSVERWGREGADRKRLRYVPGTSGSAPPTTSW